MDTVVLIKVIASLLYPLGLVIVLLLGAGVAKLARRVAWSRGCCIGALAVLLIASNPLFANSLARSLEQRYPQQPLADIAVHDVIIVLGGGVRIPLPPAQQVQIGAGSDRLWYAARLYKAGKASRIFLTGGNVYAQQGFRGEAYYASQLLQQWGVPASAITLESNSRTTAQNKNYLAQTLAEQQIKSALLVTSALHMPRAYALFRKLPISMTPASADVLIRDKHVPAIMAWLPSAAALHLSTLALHEYYGRWFGRWFGR